MCVDDEAYPQCALMPDIMLRRLSTIAEDDEQEHIDRDGIYTLCHSRRLNFLPCLCDVITPMGESVKGITTTNKAYPDN